VLETNDFALDYFGHQARTDVQLLLILLADSPDLDVLLIASEDLQLQVVVALQPVHRVDTGCNLSVRLPIMTKLVRSDLCDEVQFPVLLDVEDYQPTQLVTESEIPSALTKAHRADVVFGLGHLWRAQSLCEDAHLRR